MGISKDIIETEVRFTSNEAMANLSKLESQTADLRKENERMAVTKAKFKSLGKEESEDYKKLSVAMDANRKKIKENESSMAALRRTIGLSAMSMGDLKKRANELRGQLDSTSKAANPAEYARLEKQLGLVRRQMDTLQTGTKKTGALMRTLGTLLPVASVAALITGIISAGKELFNLSKRVQAEDRKALIVLGDSMGYVEDQANKLSKRIGVTNHEFTAMVTNTADLLVPLDFTRQKAAEMSVQIQSLAGAMDEWTAGQFGVADASTTLNKAVLGEMEELKKYGIAIRQDSEEFRNLVKQKKADGAATDEQARAMASLELIMKKSRDAQASFAGEGNKLIRMQKSLALWWRQLKENVIGYFDTNPAEKIRQEKEMVNRLVVQLADANTSESTRRDIMEKLKDLAPDIVRSLDDEGKATKATADQLRVYNSLMVDRIILSEQQLEYEKEAKNQADAESKRAKSGDRIIDQINARIESVKDEQQQMGFRRVMLDNELSLLQKIEKLKKDGLIIDTKSSTQTAATRLAMGYLDIQDPLIGAIDRYRELMQVEREQKWTVDDLFKQMQEMKGQMGLLMPGPYAPGFDPNANVTETKKTTKELLAVLEESYQERLAKIESLYASEQITKGRHDAEMLSEELAYIQAQIALKQKLGESTADLELKYQEKLSSIREQEQKYYQDLIGENTKSLQDMDKLAEDYFEKLADADAKVWDEKIEASKAATEALQKIREDDLKKEQDALQKKASIYQDLINQISSAVYDFTSDQENGMQNLAKSVANIALELLKTQVEVAIAGVTIQALASPESVATYGAAGLAKAAILVGLIEAAFAGVKGLVNSGIDSYYEGKSGNNKWSGGYTASGPWDRPQGIVHSDEFVANRYAVRNREVRPILDVIDMAQRSGRISQLNTETILRAVEARRGGYASGGYAPVSQQGAAPVVAGVDPELKALIAQNATAISELRRELQKGISAFVSYKDIKKKTDEMDGIINSTTMS